MSEKYRIVRFYSNGGKATATYGTLATGLTFEEARVHCSGAEASSHTCKEPENVKRTEYFGAWFDGFERE